jgi:fatty acid desaturase
MLFFPIASAWVFFVSRPFVQFLPRYTIPALIYTLFGLKPFFLYNIAGWVAGIIGLSLFHLQHQVNTPYRVAKSRKSTIDAGLYGSTLLKIRWPFTIITLGIEFHHIHHASTRVPGYNLADCHNEGEALGLFKDVNRVGGYRAFVSMFHALFKGRTKFSHADHHDPDHELPSFVTFWPYSALSLYDQS